MSLPLPTLDDRRWADLVEEGRALIPLYGPDWTDHNIHDPGIMLMELLAWVTEMDIYWLNQVPDEHKRKFLALAGITPRPPQPARALFQFDLRAGEPAQHLPAAMLLEAGTTAGQALPFETTGPITIVPGRLEAIQRAEDAQSMDLTGQWRRGESFLPWGSDPMPGATLYLGLTEPLPGDEPVSVYFSLAGPGADTAERQRIVEEADRVAAGCPPPQRCDEVDVEEVDARQESPPALVHHSVHLEWSYWSESGHWIALQAGDQVQDGTRALTLDGPVVFELQERARTSSGDGVRQPLPAMAKRALGEVEEPYYYLRCQIAYGAYDKAPEMDGVSLNGVVARQAAPVGQAAWPIAHGAQLPADPPDLGQVYPLQMQLDDQGRISRLELAAGPAPRLRLLEYRPPGSQEGRLTVEAFLVKDPGGTGRPHQELSLPEAAVLPTTLQLYTHENGRWRAWEQRDDFETSSRSDAHYLLDATTGRVAFGDGERGRVVPPGVPILAAYHATEAAGGNLRPEKTSMQLATNRHNKVVAADIRVLGGATENINMPFAAGGGQAAETIGEATGRALGELDRSQRAVAFDDYTELATSTPGARVARAAVKENHHPSFPCFVAPGVVTVLVLPYLPAGRPAPSAGLRQAIAGYLNARRVIGTRIEVIGPTYLDVIVRARVQACAGVDTTALQQQIVDRLHLFFSALPPGGPEGDGWPFGRDVYRSEILQILDEEQGVENVLALELLSDICEPSCNNICVGPLGLVASGPHEIQVES